MLQQLRGFLPLEIIDAHVHIYDASFTPVIYGKGSFSEERQEAADYFQHIKRFIPDSACHRAVFLPAPEASFGPACSETRIQAMSFMADELNKHPESIGAAFVGPEDSARDIEKQLIHDRIRGLKCYYSSSSNCSHAFPDEFLPESAWQIANEHAMFITLHLGRSNALADVGNLDYILAMARKYPRAKLVLAHCGRSFAAWTAVGTIKQLSECKNIYYDISSINEASPIFTCLKYAGKDHVFWGSDFPVSSFIGRVVSVGGHFVWLNKEAVRMADCTVEPVTVLEENLMAAYLAADMIDLSTSDVQALFYSNAERVLFSSV